MSEHVRLGTVALAVTDIDALVLLAVVHVTIANGGGHQIRRGRCSPLVRTFCSADWSDHETVMGSGVIFRGHSR